MTKIFKNIVIVTVLTGLTLGAGWLNTIDLAHAMVKGVKSTNYSSYVKPVTDSRYGYNKGECQRPYADGEELFYTEEYDHWNVDLVYDKSLVTSRKLAIAYAKANYPKCSVQFTTNQKKILNRKGKKIVYIEKVLSISSGKKYGYTIKGHHYVRYNKKVKKGNKVVSYFVWNPKTNYIDDVVAVADNKRIR